MSLEARLQHDLVALLAAGASLELPVGTRLQHDLVSLAIAAKNAGTHLTLTQAGFRLQHDLIAIAVAGKGHVTIKS
ncbi:hypothetical protein [Pseudomonas entomophila]|uniref:hypothetical protein n=1 Tax=Pseudomonas entomophila TaxID=312306 RepID=UPI001F02C57E|nr:hypothetical protein [Pseudomonas entomophila]MCG8291919.1 hypothetical protein [Pseudomonas entomophila]